ncbi:hypothetical protein [Mesorhizobium sp. M7A.F.Ca.US.001.02.1.1]|uniref:hypothetical protein n=1 Tax=Mesorhizobium sp. M7A.F.Ca.US.001.02.1.1 TaxID=2496703 RepID=UPI0013E3D76F|nr:hypothetical protein [Mesorhizobium sp. M7A.F.Ca.US.001.02.1.1]
MGRLLFMVAFACVAYRIYTETAGSARHVPQDDGEALRKQSAALGVDRLADGMEPTGNPAGRVTSRPDCSLIRLPAG